MKVKGNLGLNKVTVANLNIRQMRYVFGGKPVTCEQICHETDIPDLKVHRTDTSGDGRTCDALNFEP